MATVFMKWLETRPEDYDRGIRILTLGKIRQIKQKIVDASVQTGMHVLEIGCGTGTLAAMMAAKGAFVTGIDSSPTMLNEARKKADKPDIQGHLTLEKMDAALIGEKYQKASFDLIVSTLVFSEFPPDLQQYVLAACKALLAPGGRLLIVDEVVPTRFPANLFYYLLHGPLVLLTWLLTRTSTSPLRRPQQLFKQAGFHAHIADSQLSESLVLFEAQAASEKASADELPPQVIGRLRRQVNLKTLLLDLWLLFFRIIPPYPKVRTGLYALGNPDKDSPVLVTGNFELTVRRLVNAIDGKVNAWLLVADSAGINVWCGAGGGYFTADKVIAEVKTTHLDKVVDQRRLILPQLCANGVDGKKIRVESGWNVLWGPAKARDIPAYLAAHYKKTDAMRWVRFPLLDRLEMVTVTLGFYGLMILLPVFIFWRSMFWPICLSMLGLSYFYAVVHPWLPGKDGLYKSIPLGIIALAGLFAYTTIWHPMPTISLFHWIIGLIGLSVFTAAELQGMSPLMRGEQANWSREALIGLILGMVYWLLPMATGWR